MPTSAYALARYWLRVDGVVVRVVETRLWARFEDGKPWLRERTCREATFTQLAALGLSVDPRAYTNPDLFVSTLPVVSSAVEAIFLS
jgi:type 2A phosphatase activator TIP41